MGIGASQSQICPALHPVFLVLWGSKTQGIAHFSSFCPQPQSLQSTLIHPFTHQNVVAGHLASLGKVFKPMTTLSIIPVFTMTMMLTWFGFRLKIVVVKPMKTTPAPATSDGAV